MRKSGLSGLDAVPKVGGMLVATCMAIGMQSAQYSVFMNCVPTT